MSELDLFTVLWDDRTASASPQRHLVDLGGDTYLLCDGTPTDLTKVMGPVSFMEGIALAQRLLRDGILSESDMARALAVCMVLVGATTPLADGVKARLMHVAPALRARKNARQEAAEIAEDLRERVVA